MNLLTAQDHAHDDNNAFMLALAVLKERIEKLPNEDKNELFDATKAFLMADSANDRASAIRAMHEIMDQKVVKAKELLLSTDGEKLSEWRTFVSQKIRKAREDKHWTQAELAEKAGLTQSHISRLEKAEHSPNNKTLRKIADALEIPASLLDPSA